MEFFELEPYLLAGGRKGKWAMRITQIRQDSLGIEEQPFFGGPTFDSELDALRYGVQWVASRGGQVRKSVMERIQTG